jgi:hypothetical protein
MPRSKSKRRRYQPSPPWFGALILIFFGLGVVTIILNYLSLVPFTAIDPSNWFLFGGLGGIALGFVLSTQWH